MSRLLILLVICCSWIIQLSHADGIVVTSNPGNSAWWLAYAISDASTTGVELKDSGAYLDYKQYFYSAQLP